MTILYYYKPPQWIPAVRELIHERREEERPEIQEVLEAEGGASVLDVSHPLAMETEQLPERIAERVKSDEEADEIFFLMTIGEI